MYGETDVVVLPPPLFNYDADDLLGEWKQWFQKLEDYLVAYDQADSPDEDKIRVLLNHLGNEGKEIYESLEAKDSPGERVKSFTELTEALAVYFESAKNVLFERFKFFRLKRKSELPVIEFVNELTKAASCCEFTEKENIIRDKLLEQIQDKSLIERLLVEGGSLTLERAVKICQKWENRKGQVANENKPPKPGIDPDPPKTSTDSNNGRKRDTKQVKCAELPVVTILGIVPQLINQNPSVETNIWDNEDSRDYSDSREYSDPEKDTSPRNTDRRGSMCDVCGKMFALPCLLKRHMEVHSGKRYECTKCDFRAALRSTVNSHMRVHESRKFSCNMCDFKARRSYGLKMHKLTNHSDERPFKCDKCDKGFPDLGALNYHKKTRHLPSTNGNGDTNKPDEVHYNYTCDTCGHKFISESRYKLHIEGHKGNPYQCYACNFKTTSRNNIIRHLAQQHGSQTFSCDVCGFSAKCRRTIRSHKRIHGSQTENGQCLNLQTTCDVCGLDTKCRKALSKHKRIHGARNIACGFCEFKSYKRATMTAHMRRHTGERPFECSFCGYKAAQRGTLRKHIEVMHNKDSTTNKKSKGGSQPASDVNSDQNVDSSHHNPLVYPPSNNPNVDASYNHSYHNPHVPPGNPSAYSAPNYYNPHTNTYYNNPNVDMGHNNSPFDLDQFVRSNMIS